MVGGKVIEVAEVKDRPNVLFIDVMDKPRGRSIADTCAIYVEKNENSLRIQEGDSVWWQGGWAMWTPQDSPRDKCGKNYDIRIPRVGFSGVKHPARKESQP